MSCFEKYSKEWNLLADRVKMGCAAQSRQIDKTKIGEAVKGIPKIWKQYQKIQDTDTLEERKRKEFYNSILVDRKPYFFKYKYKQLNKELNDYNKKTNENAQSQFGITLKELLAKDFKDLTERQQEFLYYYEKFLPVCNSDSVMNNVCKYIESIDFEIKKKIRSTEDFDYKIFQTENFKTNKTIQNKLMACLEEEVAAKKEILKAEAKLNKSQDIWDKETWLLNLKMKLSNICSNETTLANYLIEIFYMEKPSYSKGILWGLCGKQIYETILSRTRSFDFPVKNKSGEVEYLYEKYLVETIQIPESLIKGTMEEAKYD